MHQDNINTEHTRNMKHKRDTRGHEHMRNPAFARSIASWTHALRSRAPFPAWDEAKGGEWRKTVRRFLHMPADP